MTDTKRAQILAAAMGVIAEKGFAETSMNDIVRASGLSKGGVYWHFDSKDAVITALFDTFFAGQMAALDEILAQPGSAEAKLRQLGVVSATAVVEMTAQMPLSLDFYAMAARDEALLSVLSRHFASYETRIATVLADGVASGEFREVDVVETAVTIIGLFEGVVLLWSVLGDQIDLIGQMHAALDLLLAGLTPPDVEHAAAGEPAI